MGSTWWLGRRKSHQNRRRRQRYPQVRRNRRSSGSWTSRMAWTALTSDDEVMGGLSDRRGQRRRRGRVTEVELGGDELRLKMRCSKTNASRRGVGSVRCAQVNETEWTRCTTKWVTELSGVSVAATMSFGCRRTWCSRGRWACG